MKRAIIVAATCFVAMLTAGCVEPPVKPIPDAVRRSVTTVSADLSGVNDSDTSKLGARGSEEGSKLGALQGAATVARGANSLLGLALIPIGAAAGSAKGAIEAQPADVVDRTRTNLRLAIQETDFAGLLRQRLAGSKGGGQITFAAITSGPSTAPTKTPAGVPVGHVISLEYRLNIYGEHLVNPQIGVHVRVTAQVQSPDRNQLLHTATWTYCGDRYDFVQIAEENAAAFRQQIDIAATVLAEAIPHDLYVSNQPRRLTVRGICMDFSDLPSRTGQTPVATRSAPAPIPEGTPIPIVNAPPVGPSPNAFDGNWQVDMDPLSTTYGTTVGGECPARHSAGATFSNGIAEWPRGNLRVSGNGEVSGWMNVPAVGTSTLPFIVNISGRLENNVIKGTVSGRCTGSFVMKRQSPAPAAAAAAPVQVVSAAPVVPAANAVDGNWQLEVQVSSTFCVSQSTPVTFANRIAEGPWGKLQVSADGDLGGWMKLKPLNTASVDYLVNLSGRLENGVIAGSLSGRCPGTFVLRKQ